MQWSVNIRVYATIQQQEKESRKPTLHVLDALSFLARLADDLDRLTGKRAELQVSCHHKLDENLNFLAFFISIINIQLFRYTFSGDDGKSRRVVLGRCPVQHSLLTACFTTDRDDHLWWSRSRDASIIVL